MDVLREMRATAIGFPVLVLTARDALGERIRGLDAGADDYLVKPFELGELEARLGPCCAAAAATPRHGGSSGPCDSTCREAPHSPATTPSSSRAARPPCSSASCAGPGRIVAKEAILAAAFPSDSEAAPNAVEVQVSRLRRKLEAVGVTVRALRGLGYRLEETGDHALE